MPAGVLDLAAAAATLEIAGVLGLLALLETAGVLGFVAVALETERGVALVRRSGESAGTEAGGELGSAVGVLRLAGPALDFCARELAGCSLALSGGVA